MRGRTVSNETRCAQSVNYGDDSTMSPSRRGARRNYNICHIFGRGVFGAKRERRVPSSSGNRAANRQVSRSASAKERDSKQGLTVNSVALAISSLGSPSASKVAQRELIPSTTMHRLPALDQRGRPELRGVAAPCPNSPLFGAGKLNEFARFPRRPIEAQLLARALHLSHALPQTKRRFQGDSVDMHPLRWRPRAASAERVTGAVLTPSR